MEFVRLCMDGCVCVCLNKDVGMGMQPLASLVS